MYFLLHGFYSLLRKNVFNVSITFLSFWCDAKFPALLPSYLICLLTPHQFYVFSYL